MERKKTIRKKKKQIERQTARKTHSKRTVRKRRKEAEEMREMEGGKIALEEERREGKHS